MWRPLGSGASLRCAGAWLEYGARSFRPRYTQVGYGTRSFAATLHATGARYTQFCHTLHANGVRYTQFLRPRKLREASNAQVDEAALLSGPRKNCVHHASSACTVGRNCVQRAPRARNLLEAWRFACSARRNCVQRGRLREPRAGRPRQNPTATPIRFFAYPASNPPSRPTSAEPQLSHPCAGSPRQTTKAAASFP